MKNYLLLIVLTLISLSIHAQSNYYVSTSGSDAGSGSIDDPWKTIQHAMDNASPGSTVMISGGTYNEKVYMNVSGTPGNWIVFKNNNNEQVIIDGSGWTDPAICEIYDQSYIRLEGLHFKNNVREDAMGIFIEGLCHHIEIINCKISEIHFSNDPNAPINETTNSQPLIVYGVEDTPITDLLIEGCEIFDSRTGYSEALAINGNVNGFEISSNTIHHITNIGIDIIGHEGTCSNPALDQARNGTIGRNTVYNCQSPYASSAGIYVDGGKELIIENNTVYNNQWGIEVGCENIGKTTSGVIVRNNVIYQNTSAGIQLGGYDFPSGSGKVTNSKILNNTLFDNATINYYDGELTLTYSENCEVVNNVFYATNPEAQTLALEDVETIPPGLVLNHNLWYHPDGSNEIYIYWSGMDYESFDDFVNSTGFEVNSIFADPIFVSTSSTNPDLHIKSDSPAKNAADQSYIADAGEKDMDNEDRVNESLDLGADEYHVSSGIFSQQPAKSLWFIQTQPVILFIWKIDPTITKLQGLR
ncbi:MAG: right-handed parallel beta-helix repeat-containing protein [Bacteroidales bacterium]